MKTHATSLLFGAMIAASCSAQPRPNRIEVKGHFIGESVEKFYQRAGLGSFLASCKASAGDKKEMKRLDLAPDSCEAALRALRGDDIWTIDPNWETAAEKRRRTNPFFAKYGVRPTSQNAAVLSGGKLAKVTIELLAPLDEVLPLLAKKYGQPQDLRTQNLENGVAATAFRVSSAQWRMPDGVVISAIEVAAPPNGDPTRFVPSTNVVFSSKEEFEKQTTKAKMSNSSNYVSAVGPFILEPHGC